MSFKPWMKASPTRTRQPGGGEVIKISSHQRMIFKLANLSGRAMQNHHVVQDEYTVRKVRGKALEIGLRGTGKDAECFVVTDLGTSFNEACLSKE